MAVVSSTVLQLQGWKRQTFVPPRLKRNFPPQWSEAPVLPLGGVPITLLGASDWLGLCPTNRLLSFLPPLPELG